MLQNYFKIAVRNLMKHKVLSVINLTGLSVSIAFCILLFLHIRFEKSFDSFHDKGKNLYRLEMTNIWSKDEKPKQHLFSFLTKEDETENQLVFPLVVGPALQANFPEVKSVTRFNNAGATLVRIDDEVY